MADDRTLSEKIIDSTAALKHREEMAPVVDKVTRAVNEYRELIDNGWHHLGHLLEHGENQTGRGPAASHGQPNHSSWYVTGCDYSIAGTGLNSLLFDLIMTSAKTEITRHKDEIETRNAVVAAETMLEGFSHNFIPYVKTGSPTEKNMKKLHSLISNARAAMVKLYKLIPDRAASGDGADVLISQSADRRAMQAHDGQAAIRPKTCSHHGGQI
jgi:hypothetical protein